MNEVLFFLIGSLYELVNVRNGPNGLRLRLTPLSILIKQNTLEIVFLFHFGKIGCNITLDNQINIGPLAVTFAPSSQPYHKVKHTKKFFDFVS